MKLTAKPLKVYIPDTRGVVLEHRYGKGNLKIGPDVFTYSRMPGKAGFYALGTYYEGLPSYSGTIRRGTCPGATPECQKVCYARRPVKEGGIVADMWARNNFDDVPPIPEECRLLRIHVSGDFDTIAYITNWYYRLKDRPDVHTWAYTRSWRVPELVPYLAELKSLPNVQLFASMDSSHDDVPPAGWRRAWLDGDPRAGEPQQVRAHMDDPIAHNLTTFDGGRTYVCPEETKRVPNCQECKYCFEGKQHDVTFLLH